MKYIKVYYYSLTIYLLCNILSCSVSDYTTDLGDNYLFVSESNANQFITNLDNSNGHINIPCTIESVEFDDKFIIATQRSNPDCFGNDFPKKSLHYWIIDKEKKTDFGPLDSLTYLKLRNDFGVSKSLNINY